jgi:hypothetical protein
MTWKPNQQILHGDGILIIQHQIRQKPMALDGHVPIGEEAVNVVAVGIKQILAYSGVTLNEAREALKGKKGKHLETVLSAIDLIESESKPNKEIK